MPNTEVKLTNAESTWPEAAREDRKLLIKEKTLTNVGVFFHMPELPICMHKFGVIGHFVLIQRAMELVSN